MKKAFVPNLSSFPVERVRLLAYGGAGVGKSTMCLSLLKNPKLNLVFFALESTSLAALRNSFSVWGIEELREGQLIYVTPEPAKTLSAEALSSRTDGTYYTNIIRALFSTKGWDVAAEKEVTLGKFSEYKADTVFIFDGISAFVEAIANKAMGDAVVKTVDGDPRAVYGIGQGYMRGLFTHLTTATKAHVIACGHSVQSDDKALQKFKGLKALHPNLYTKSLVDEICGMFTYVLYVKRNSQTNRFSMTCADSSIYVRDGINREKFKEIAARCNAALPAHMKIALDNLPCDLTHEVYDFFK